jgi:hypothetical protein
MLVSLVTEEHLLVTDDKEFRAASPVPRTSRRDPSPAVPLRKLRWDALSGPALEETNPTVASKGLKNEPFEFWQPRDSYQYTPISAHQVRLLVIKSGLPEDAINVSFLAVDDELLGGDKYPYMALSYCWGDVVASKAVIVQDDLRDRGLRRLDDFEHSLRGGSKDRPVLVRPNLYEALKHVRHERELVSTWVDALCINQLDVQERNEQVSKMAAIYRSAYNVCIWLDGEDTNKIASAAAMQSIPNMINRERYESLKDGAQTPRLANIFELLKSRW